MEGRPDRQRPGGSVVPVLRDTGGYTLAVIVNPLSPRPLPSSSSSSLASFLFASTAEQVEGGKEGGGGLQQTGRWVHAFC